MSPIAFLGFYVGIVVLRGIWLGDPLVIALHRLQSGALLLFAFFMISDPKTTPDTRAWRVIFALLVALGAACVQFGLFRTNGLLWWLVACAPRGTTHQPMASGTPLRLGYLVTGDR